MPSASEGLVKMELGQSAVDLVALDDAGDHLNFVSDADYWSAKAGYKPEVRVDGILTGGLAVPAASASNDKVDLTAFTAYIAGVKVTGSAASDIAMTRPATAVSKICSIVCSSVGVVSAIAGTDGTTTAFSETRAAAGGPPLIPADAIEIAQWRVTDDTAAPVAGIRDQAGPWAAHGAGKLPELLGGVWRLCAKCWSRVQRRVAADSYRSNREECLRELFHADYGGPRKN